MVLFAWNDTYLPLRNVTQGMEYSQAARNAGFQDGDILLRADERSWNVWRTHPARHRRRGTYDRVA